MDTALFVFIIVYGLVAANAASIAVGEGTQNNTGLAPPGADDEPNGYWFGTQDILCVMGSLRQRRSFSHLFLGGMGSQPRRRKRAPARLPISVAHRLLYYKGTVLEWGTGSDMYSASTQPAVEGCTVTWESTPASLSHCTLDEALHFTENYRSVYGTYNIFTNNCHHFANRLASLLHSTECRVRPDAWAKHTRSFWRVVSDLTEEVDARLSSVRLPWQEEEIIPEIQ